MELLALFHESIMNHFPYFFTTTQWIPMVRDTTLMASRNPAEKSTSWDVFQTPWFVDGRFQRILSLNWWANARFLGPIKPVLRVLPPFPQETNMSPWNVSPFFKVYFLFESWGIFQASHVTVVFRDATLYMTWSRPIAWGQRRFETVKLKKSPSDSEWIEQYVEWIKLP